MDRYSFKKRSLTSMTPQELVLELLARAVYNIRRARIAMARKKYEAANSALIDTQNILLELQGMMKSSDPATANTSELLEYLAEELFFANLNNNPDHLDELLSVVQRLRTIYALRIGRV